jgi:hypothetical protein
MDAMLKRLVTTAAALWAVWVLLTWITSTWKDMTDLGRTEVVLLGALAQLLFWVGLVCVGWAVGAEVLRSLGLAQDPDPAE